jgi:hypothetical protein
MRLTIVIIVIHKVFGADERLFQSFGCFKIFLKDWKILTRCQLLQLFFVDNWLRLLVVVAMVARGMLRGSETPASTSHAALLTAPAVLWRRE